MTNSSTHLSDSKYNARAVDRALSILMVFVNNPDVESLSLAEMVSHLDLPQGTIFRLLAILKNWGFIEQNLSTKKYSLGVTSLSLGNTYLIKNDLRKRAYPILKLLRDETGETTHLAIREGVEAIYLEKLDGLYSIGLMSSRIGGRSPIYCTGVGKALIGFLPSQERENLLNSIEFFKFTKNTIICKELLENELSKMQLQGYCTDNEEHELGVACIAAPIFDHNDRVISAISISGPTERIFDPEKKNVLVDKVKKKAHEITTAMGGKNVNSL